jgi:nucleoid-associated protein YgaU
MDKETTPFQAAQPGPEDDWQYETDRSGGRILWGRILALAVALVLAFLAGRVTAGGNDSTSAASLEKVKKELAAARATIAAENAVPSPTAEVTPESTPTPEPTDSATAASTTYTVKSGDTLRGIAAKFYGDSSLDDLIAQANDITDPSLLHPGTELLIPPKP